MHDRHDKDPVVTGTSLSRWTCPVANNALRCALFKLLFMDTVHKRFPIFFSNPVGPLKKKTHKLGRHNLHVVTWE